jgi:transcriptional regulator with GAF, ATPase, and Fis domain
MQSQTNLSSVNRSHVAERHVTGALKARRRPARKAAEPTETTTTSIDARIGSLKILAQSLMRQIEFLQKEAASGSTLEFDAQSEVRRFEAELIRSALISTGGRQRRAARLLGMKVTTINTKIKRYQIKLDKDPVLHERSAEFPPEEPCEIS